MGDTTTTSPSSADRVATPASATTIVPTKCPSKPAAALCQESLLTSWATPSVSTTNNADPTVTTTSTSTRSVAPTTSACPTTTALSCTMVPPLSEVVVSPSSPRTWTTSPSSVALTTAPPTSPTPMSPLSTRCTGATSTRLPRLAPRFLAPADIPLPPATLFAVKPIGYQECLFDVDACYLFVSLLFLIKKREKKKKPNPKKKKKKKKKK